MKIKTLIILVFCVILSSCTKKEIIDEIQVIEIPEGKCARQVGVYTYPTKMEIERTVPIVEIME